MMIGGGGVHHQHNFDESPYFHHSHLYGRRLHGGRRHVASPYAAALAASIDVDNGSSTKSLEWLRPHPFVHKLRRAMADIVVELLSRRYLCCV